MPKYIVYSHNCSNRIGIQSHVSLGPVKVTSKITFDRLREAMNGGQTE